MNKKVQENITTLHKDISFNGKLVGVGDIKSDKIIINAGAQYKGTILTKGSAKVRSSQKDSPKKNSRLKTKR